MTYRYRIASIFLLGFFIDCINIFMSAIALPAVADDMQISIVSVTWVSNSYILGLTLIIPLSHWLSQRFGIRALMVTSMLMFSVSVALVGDSHSFSELILWRFIQGVSGGLLIPIGQALTFQYFQGHERSKISTIIMAIALIAPAISPTLGGFIVDMASWRWVFYSNIPFSLLTALLAFIWVKEPLPKENAIPDIKGIILISLVIVSGLFALSAYGEYHSTLLALVIAALSACFAVLYYYHYRRHISPVINLSLLKNRNLSISIFVYYCIPGVFTGVNILAIFYLQQYLKFTAQGTGVFMLLYALGAFISMTISGVFYNKLGMKRLFIFALLLHSIGIALLIFVNSNTDIPLLIIAYLVIGIGGGIGANTAQTTALYDFNSQKLVQASVIWNINRQVVFSVGATVVAMLFNILSLFYLPQTAYNMTFLICALIGILPITLLFTLKKKILYRKYKMKFNTDLIIESIRSLHDEIEAVFTQFPLSIDAITKIENLLSSEFSMVGINGKAVSYDDVIAMFRQNAGKRSGLKIKTDDYKIIYQSDCLVVVRYQEIHSENKKILMRESVALLRRNSHETSWQWHYLHETPIINN